MPYTQILKQYFAISRTESAIRPVTSLGDLNGTESKSRIHCSRVVFIPLKEGGIIQPFRGIIRPIRNISRNELWIVKLAHEEESFFTRFFFKQNLNK